MTSYHKPIALACTQHSAGVVNYKKALLPQKNRTMCYASRNLVNWRITVGKQTHLFNGPVSGTTQVSWYQKGKDNLDFTKARDSEWQWHQLGHMQACTSLQTDNHASTPPRSFLQAGCPSATQPTASKH